MWIAIRPIFGGLLVIGALLNLLNIGTLENEVQVVSYLVVTAMIFLVGALLLWWAYDSYKSQNVD